MYALIYLPPAIRAAGGAVAALAAIGLIRDHLADRRRAR